MYDNIEVGIHRLVTPTDAVGHFIDDWTRRVCKPPWTLQGGPSTHAFLIVDGFRLDAGAPCTAWHVDKRLSKENEARWKLNIHPDLKSGFMETARLEEGRIYDIGEGVQQLAVPFISFFNKSLGNKIAKDKGFEFGKICTTTVTSCLLKAGPVFVDLVNQMNNRAPETLGWYLDKYIDDKYVIRSY